MRLPNPQRPCRRAAGRQTEGCDRVPTDRGFTLVELLVVIAVLAILLAIIVPVTAKGIAKAERIACMNNLRNFTIAAIAYSSENEGRLVHSYPGNSAINWVGTGNTTQSLESGALWKYTGSHSMFRCPSVPAELTQIRSQNRHYSPNNYLHGAGWYPGIAYTLSSVPQPSRTIYFLEEPDPRGANLGSWVMRLTSPAWVDPIGYWHSNGSNFSFVDGHAEYWRWEDPRTKIPGQTGRFFVNQPGNPDLLRVQLHQMPGDPRGPNP